MTIAEHARPFHANGGPVGVVLCHGFTGTPTSMVEWARHLAAAGFTVAVPRLPGHGTTWQELSVTSWQDWYDCVDAEYQALAQRCSVVFVAGISMGGSLALRLAEQHPQTAGLMLINPALGAVDPLARLAPVLKYVVRRVDSIGNDIHKPGVDEGGYDVTPTAAVAELLALWADVRSCLDLVTCPIIVFRSTVDHVVPASSTEIVVRQVSSDDITEIMLPNSYHVATMDYDADTIFAASTAFVERVSADRIQA